MKKRIRKWQMLILIVLCQNIVAQSKGFKKPDSLLNKNYEYLSDKVVSSKSEKGKASVYAKAWLSKSKSEQNWTQMTSAYRAVMYLEDKKRLLAYSDSLIFAAKKSNDLGAIGTAYLTKGIVHYDRKELKKALDNYLIADEYIIQTEDDYAIHKVKYSIAHTKYYLGFYDEAIALFKECSTYFQTENDRAYLNAIHSLGLCYNKIGNFNLCTYYNQLGLEESKKLLNNEMVVYFNHSEGINQYSKKEYTQSINTLNSTLQLIKNKNDFANETVANFYIGKSYWALNQENRAIPYLLKVYNAFVKQKYLRPDLRENFELLINYYKKHKKPKAQLIYINRLLEADSILNQNYKYLSRKIFKVYDTKKLLQVKKELEQATIFKSRMLYGIVASLTTGIILLTCRHYRNKKYYKLKFQEIMNSNSEKRIHSNKKINPEELDINPDVITMVIKNLEKFENNKKYLEKDMNLLRIATLLNTNTKYASKIIYKYRGKKTIEYISDLKIDHIVDILKNQNKYRLYTNKALGEEAGFGSTQNFTKAFKNRTDISPTYFIEELKKVT